MSRCLLVGVVAAVAVTSSAMAEPPARDVAPARNSTSATKLAYVMVFVADMNRSVAFYRDQVGLKLRFASPNWSEFETGGTILALHPAGEKHPAGTSEIGVTVDDLNGFYEARRATGVSFEGRPKPQQYGEPLAEMRDPDGADISVGGR